MSIFKRNVNFNSNNHKKRIIKTGVDYLDEKIFKNIGFGTTILLEEDEITRHTETALKMFISYNLTYNQNYSLHSFSKDHKELKIPTIERKDLERSSQELEKMIIAWRYTNYEKELPKNSYNFKHKMDLSNKNFVFCNDKSINEMLTKISNLPKGSIIVIFSLFSPRWFDFEDVGLDLNEYLFKLKTCIKKNNHFLITSMPKFLYKSENFYPSVFFDIVIEFKTFLFTKYLPSYSGIIILKKLFIPNIIEEFNLESDRFGFLANKDGIFVEKIVIPPEESTGEFISCNNTDLF